MAVKVIRGWGYFYGFNIAILAGLITLLFSRLLGRWRGEVQLVEWGNLRLLLSVGMSFDDMEELENVKRVGRVSSLLLADSSFAPLNTPEWIANLQLQVLLLQDSPAQRFWKQYKAIPCCAQAVTGGVRSARMWVEVAR